jgi:hypothetical protein
MITRELAERFAHEWIEAWNSHDLERILAHYSDDFVMSSPRIAVIAEECSRPRSSSSTRPAKSSGRPPTTS